MTDLTTTTPARPGSGQMFDAIAPRYDLLNRIMSGGLDQGWRRRLVRAVAAPKGAHLLDLATGTADVALALARTYPDSTVVGSDPSTQMLAVGREKVTAQGLAARVSLEVGDAQALPFADGTFDGVTIAFGIRNVPDRPRALAEMARVVRPGGRVCILELGEPDSALARLHVHHIVPRLGALLSGSREYRYLQTSIAAFPPAAAFCDLMRSAGLVDVVADRLFMGAAHIYVGRVPAT
ncbi:bifunctional demethylmenaquinone methyltransferase/2-methoxy-6-polyprenyl-1,4-benzoquinol methylase UbiE [Myxococcota bacterium]|nr:bifunctional demethylmenaquinone methyltransferase/2-methoxy-6-polyprenyl-1,4-benzoquinol methylase UbiE [Myxococcota bacterium]